MCGKHYSRFRSTGSTKLRLLSINEGPCLVSGCLTSATVKEMCLKHYRRKQRTGSPYINKDNLCSINDCDTTAYKRGLCGMHIQRLNRTGTTALPSHYPIPPARWRTSPAGYVHRSNNGKDEMQHRLVMAETLGRPLETWENVHHMNGVKDDNRPENLELWVEPQPSGQRVQDLVDWVRQHHIPACLFCETGSS